MSAEDDNIVYTTGRRIGINKPNPKKALEVGGDVLIDKKLVVCEDANLGVGVCLGENAGKKRAEEVSRDLVRLPKSSRTDGKTGLARAAGDVLKNALDEAA